ncbi:MAG: hypothetical protein C0483_21610 [Pirellula sp.]|nr:hypothetical protein [Pirellula sp.]
MSGLQLRLVVGNSTSTADGSSLRRSAMTLRAPTWLAVAARAPARRRPLVCPSARPLPLDAADEFPLSFAAG